MSELAISACEKGGQWEKALDLFKDMRSQGIKPNVITYSATISACFNSHKLKEALKLLQDGQANGHFPRFSQQQSSKWDLHGFTFSESCMLLSDALLFVAESKLQESPSFMNILVVTGKGRRSSSEGPVLQRKVPQFLKNCSGLDVTSIAGNDGRFLLKKESVRDWSRSSRYKKFRHLMGV